MKPRSDLDARSEEGEEDHRPLRDDAATRLSLTYYVFLILFAGQFIGLLLGIPINYLFLAITGFILIATLFGPSNAIEFFRAVRGDKGGRDDDPRP